MSYVTQGTVQVEFRSQADIGIRISPLEDFTVRYENQGKKQDYVVFIDDGSTDVDDGSTKVKAFEKTRVFKSNQKNFSRYLVQAAFSHIKIEIRVESFKLTQSSSPSSPVLTPPVLILIESVRIPGIA